MRLIQSVICFAVLIVLAGCANTANPIPSAMATVSQPPTVIPSPTVAPLTRAAFVGIVRNNLSTRILARFGPPDSTQAFGETGQEYWYYHGLSYDPTTQKVDGMIQIVFEPFGNPSGGRLQETNVNFGP